MREQQLYDYVTYLYHLRGQQKTKKIFPYKHLNI